MNVLSTNLVASHDFDHPPQKAYPRLHFLVRKMKDSPTGVDKYLESYQNLQNCNFLDQYHYHCLEHHLLQNRPLGNFLYLHDQGIGSVAWC